MLKSGLLEHYDLVMDLAHKTGANQTRQFDFDALDSYINSLEGTSRTEYEAARSSLWNFLDDSVSHFLVEPRVLDMNLTENSGWNRFMDIFMSWPRAFAGQKGLGLGGRAKNVSLGHLAGFAFAQVLWDSIYTTIQEIARGEDPDKIAHMVEQDPAGWFMQKATRLPFSGAMGSQLGSVIVDYLRNMAAKMTDGEIGYLGSNSYGIDLTSSPAGGALKKVLHLAGIPFTLGSSIAGGTFNQDTVFTELRNVAAASPLFGSLYGKFITELLVADKQNMVDHKNKAYYDSQYRKKIIDLQKQKILGR
jgi:hypothetical protein